MTKYIMKNYKPDLQSGEWEYSIFDENYKEIEVLILTPENAIGLGYTSISPIDYYNKVAKFLIPNNIMKG